MEALFRDNVRNTWRPRALARMTAALQRKQEEIAALGTPPAELTLQYVWDTVIERVDLEALCTAIRTHVRAAQPGSVFCRLWLLQQDCTSVASGTTVPATTSIGGSACQKTLHSLPLLLSRSPAALHTGNLLHPERHLRQAVVAASPNT